MSQIMRAARIGIAIFSLGLMLTACGSSTPNSNSAFNNEKSHPKTGALIWHAAPARASLSSCKECHGQDLAGGISNVACSSCHINGIAVMTGCVSCHASPPSGTAVPDRAGAHAKHDALPNVTGVCGTCHSGAGSGSEQHYDGTLEVAGLSVYNAKSGSAVRNASGTCSKVSCHGGQTTPAWLSGTTIDVNTQCAVCHAFGTTEYNGYYSGLHDFHVNGRQWQNECWRCHDVTMLANDHFTDLSTPALEGQAYLTLQSWVGYNKTTGKCLALCHSAYLRGW